MTAIITTVITIDSIRTGEDASAFRRLNEEWISAFFTLESKDRETLADPFGHYVEPGGDVLLARDGDGIAIGCVALDPTGDGVFELSKMAVSPAERGRGTGRLLLEAAIDRARELGAASLFLGTNRRLAPAIGLYESAGFRHVPREEVGRLPYVRANVFMELSLQDDDASPPACHTGSHLAPG
ncbi:MAG: GNAT family N-acetyltransferase [Solirubrobacteraceae bacterium]